MKKFNPPRLDSPFGRVSRDHCKTLGVDRQIGFITGLCVGMPLGRRSGKKTGPWRDTGVEVRRSAVADIERAFAQSLGSRFLNGNYRRRRGYAADDTSVRGIATVPMTDELVAAFAAKEIAFDGRLLRRQSKIHAPTLRRKAGEVGYGCPSLP